MVNHFLPLSLGSPQIFYPCMGILKSLDKVRDMFFFFPLTFFSSSSVSAFQINTFCFLMKCVKCQFILIIAWQNYASPLLLGPYRIALQRRNTGRGNACLLLITVRLRGEDKGGSRPLRCPHVWRNSEKVPSWMPLWSITQDKVPTRVPHFIQLVPLKHPACYWLLLSYNIQPLNSKKKTDIKTTFHASSRWLLPL